MPITPDFSKKKWKKKEVPLFEKVISSFIA